jgi:UDP-N-acetylglucosamine diphosphorylase / glucose-1-phosphate thymidylyltransferase / UDP-N-acetylgalactosamine diphosphorylase / glucosamine-1-phosphate N-acetyltransferase / galactosamine-1-phosphate N-acetyltransferase
VSEPRLPLKIFVNTDSLWLNTKFSSPDAFSYLGKNLDSFVSSILREFNVYDRPVILGTVSPQAIIEGPVYVAEGAKVEPMAYIQGPAVIGPDAEVRHGAYIRGQVFVGARAVVGHTTEVKGSIFFDDAKAGHFAYVGDSLLGRHVNLGAGTKLANLKLKGNEVSFKHPDTGAIIPSGLRKFSAIMGDHAQTGCNAVLSPGTLMLPHTLVMSCAHYHGTLHKGLAR